MLRAKYKHRHKEQRMTKGKEETNPYTYSLYIGFFAGLVWGAIKLVEFALRFTDVVPGFLIEPFFQHAYLVTYMGLALGYGSFIVFSVAASFLYGVFLRQLRGPWPGIAYGLVWWSLLYVAIGPYIEMMPAVTNIDINSFVTDLSLFILWGLFIGYSIAMEFTKRASQEALPG